MNELLLLAVVYLGAGVIAVPIAQRLGLGSVLGYLLAGVAIAPLLDWMGSDPEDVQSFAEFGVVMMLFLVGLELQPRLLWDMRLRLFGLGGLQVVITALVVAVACIGFGIDWRLALALGMIFALSSTAIVLQTLGEKSWLRTEGGQSAFSVLLFQDIAVIPMLAVLPLLAGGGLDGGAAVHGGAHGGPGPFAAWPAWAQGLMTLAVVAGVVLGGRYLTRPAFRIIARTGLHELFFTAALVLIVGIAVLMSMVGLSPALGTFLAGVLLAESEYRHELVSDLEPFKGLLLGVFFITVGAGMEFGLLGQEFGLILGLTASLILVKGIILLGLATLFRMKGRARWLFAFALAQSGEFGFVLLAVSTDLHVVPDEVAAIASLVVALSMMATPLIMIAFERFVSPRVARPGGADREDDAIEEEGPVIIAGMAVSARSCTVSSSWTATSRSSSTIRPSISTGCASSVSRSTTAMRCGRACSRRPGSPAPSCWSCAPTIASARWTWCSMSSSAIPMSTSSPAPPAANTSTSCALRGRTARSANSSALRWKPQPSPSKCSAKSASGPRRRRRPSPGTTRRVCSNCSRSGMPS